MRGLQWVFEKEHVMSVHVLSEFEGAQIKKLTKQLKKILERSFDERPTSGGNDANEILAIQNELKKLWCDVTWVVGGRDQVSGRHTATMRIVFPEGTAKQVGSPQD